MDYIFMFAFIITFVNEVSSDYLCVCSHHTQREIYGTPSVNSMPLGFLYQDECKALVSQPKLDKQWIAVQFYHMIAYIETDALVNIVQCQGTIPDEDKASTMFPPTTQKPGQTSTTKPSHAVTTGISTSNPTQMNSHTTSGLQSTTYRQTSHSTSTRKTTQSTIHVTHSPTTHHHVTVIPTAAHFTIGHLELCPANVRRGSLINGFKLGQYKHSCYEVCNTPVSWFHANEMCKARRGHLATLSNLSENHFLNMLIKQYFHGKEFWIGLNDLGHEEHFTWSSGEHDSYRNWRHGRKSSHHSREDCVVMLDNGHWDDMECGSTMAFMEFLQPRHPYVCEYGTVNGAALVG
ncbi:aggrecan core protein-like [Ruditapes philippinarum]|uniref:aggrecan core protein-like n=1 Tax=Ruditapes philippinarum TaxID=129788 RepID=UPI00295AC28D|nr:aggrecan core protein-like [Ruditapes philippinarum]